MVITHIRWIAILSKKLYECKMNFIKVRFKLLMFLNILIILFKILGFHGADYEECRLLGCYAMWLF
jgi:hypothetical protein